MKFDVSQLLAAIGLKQLIIEAKDEQIRALHAQLAAAQDKADKPLDTPEAHETIVT